MYKRMVWPKAGDAIICLGGEMVLQAPKGRVEDHWHDSMRVLVDLKFPVCLPPE